MCEAAARAIPGQWPRSKVKARDGKFYEVSTAPPGGAHEVKQDGSVVGSFVLLPKETKVTVKSKAVTEILPRRHRRLLRRPGRRPHGYGPGFPAI